MSPGDVYIGRGGPFGNPFRVTPEQPRSVAIGRFRDDASRRIEVDAAYRASVKALRGKRLFCYCAPLPCHGDVLAELAESLGGD